MRLIHSFLPLLTLGQRAFAATSSSSSSSARDDSTTTGEDGVVPFLQTMQTAQVASMSCLITLVNMTQTPIGTCLGINKLAPLLMGTGSNETEDFSVGLDSYLTTVCKGKGCTDAQIGEARAQLDQTCQGQSGGGLIPTIQTILANYQSSYKTLACSIYFNGTQDNCVTDVISSNKAANSATFLMDFLTGNNLGQYTDQIWKSAQCTGCMHELYKAAVFLIPNIRSQSTTSDLGNHLQNDCGAGPDPNWPTVMDQQIPDALQVEQNTQAGSRTGSAGRRLGLSAREIWMVVGLVSVGLAMVW